MNQHREFTPHVTVASVIERDGRFLLVEERPEGELVINQPAGHLEANESLVEAAQRETLEETGCEVEIQGVVGIGLYHAPSNNVTYFRTTFFGQLLQEHPEASLDREIERPIWLTLNEIKQRHDQLRSPLVLASVERYLAGHRYPLEMLYRL